jgi:hypothetical protein
MELRNIKKVEDIITNLSKRNMNGYIVEDRKEALEKTLSLIPKNSTVGFGGSTTLEEIGILDELRKNNESYLFDRTKVVNDNQLRDLYLQMFSSDVFLSGTNAITEKGQLVNVDGIGNRTAMIAYGPRKVIIVVGKNKITNDLDSAIERIKKIALPLDLKKLKELSKNSPIFSSINWTKETIWGHVSIIERQINPKRIHIIFVNEDLGF